MLVLVQGHGVPHGHHERGGDALEHPDLQLGLPGHHEGRPVPGEPVLPGDLPGGLHRGHREASDELARHVLQLREVPAGAVHARHPGRGGLETVQGGVELLVRGVREVPAARALDDAPALGGLGQQVQLQGVGGHGVLHVVHAVGDVVREVHDLRLQALAALHRALAEPLEHGEVVLVRAELPVGPPVRPGRGVRGGPRVLARGVQRGAREVQPRGLPRGRHQLGLQPHEQPQGLGVALEAPDPPGQLREHGLPVVPERRVAEVVGQACGVDHVRVAAQRLAELPPDLRDLQRVGEAVAHEVVRLRGDHLRLGREPAQRGAVQHARAVPLEVAAVAVVVVLGDVALGVRGLVAGGQDAQAVGGVHGAQPPETSSSASTRPSRSASPRIREDSQPSGRCGFLGEPARPRGPSTSAPG